MVVQYIGIDIVLDVDMLLLCTQRAGVDMNSISITYSKDTLPYIQITPYGLTLNRDYLGYIDDDLLKGILYSEGYYDVSDELILAIKGYSDIDNQDKDVTMMFAVE
jgi:hypothetical protein